MNPWNHPDDAEARALFKKYQTNMNPWNRPEDAEARGLFKKYLQTKYPKITAEDYSYTPEIFKEVSEEEAYEIYWTSMTEDERDEQLNYCKR